MKIIIYFVLFQLIYQPMNAQGDYQEDMKKLKALNAKFIHNFVTNDVQSHSEIIHPEFVHVSSEGKYVSRKDYLINWAHGYDGYTYWDYRDENIKIFGNTALVHSQNKYTYVKDGKEFSGRSMYTDVYVKENGEWKCVQAQISNVLPQNYAPDETIVRKYEQP